MAENCEYNVRRDEQWQVLAQKYLLYSVTVNSKLCSREILRFDDKSGWRR